MTRSLRKIDELHSVELMLMNLDAEMSPSINNYDKKLIVIYHF